MVWGLGLPGSKGRSAVLSERPELAAATCGLDTRFDPMFGIPSIVFGPTGGVLHSFNEYVELDSALKVLKVLACFIADWCGVSQQESSLPMNHV